MDHRETGIEQELAIFRERLDKIDAQLVALFAARYAVVYATLSLKRSHGMPAVDRRREETIAARAEDLAISKLPTGVARQLMQSVVNVLRDEALFSLGWYARH